jgi:hypothetical protein
MAKSRAVCGRAEVFSNILPVLVVAGLVWMRGKRILFEFSLCLSRACLGQMIVLISNGAKRPFLLTWMRDLTVSIGHTVSHVTCGEYKPQNDYAFVLSQACLGKMANCRHVLLPSLSW